MKKNDQDTSLFNTDIATNKDFEVNKIKTTNVNILLNRVRSVSYTHLTLPTSAIV